MTTIVSAFLVLATATAAPAAPSLEVSMAA